MRSHTNLSNFRSLCNASLALALPSDMIFKILKPFLKNNNVVSDRSIFKNTKMANRAMLQTLMSVHENNPNLLYFCNSDNNSTEQNAASIQIDDK